MNQELVYLLPEWREMFVPQFIGWGKKYPYLDRELALHMKAEMLPIGMNIENAHVRVAVTEALRSYEDG